MLTKRPYKNKTSYNRAEHNSDNPYVCVSSAIYQDDRLGATEMGIIIYLLSNADTFIVNQGQVRERLKLGKDRFGTSWKLLTDLGYIHKIPIQGGVHWTIAEDPANLTIPDIQPSENVTTSDFSKSEFSKSDSSKSKNSNSDSSKSENRYLTSNKSKVVLSKTNTNGKLVLNKTNIKNKLPSLDSEGKSVAESEVVEHEIMYNYGAVHQRHRSLLGAPDKTINCIDKDVLECKSKTAEKPKKKDNAEQFEDWYKSYPDRGYGQIKGNRKSAIKRFKKLSESERDDLAKATELIKHINVPDDPKYYKHAEKFIQSYHDILDANSVNLKYRNIDDGSGSFEY